MSDDRRGKATGVIVCRNPARWAKHILAMPALQKSIGESRGRF